MKLIECVPNFSEGRDLRVIEQITNAIEGVEGIRLLDVDPGAATNRTVVTFAGPQAAAEEAAFLAMKRASDNAEEMVKSLTLQFNKARQAQITQELGEIMGGVEALK